MVVYRICPVMSRRAPKDFGGDKYLASKVALQSFKESLGDLRVKMRVLLDKCPESYERLFTDLWDERDLVLERHPGIGNRGTFLRQFQVVVEQNDAELVYLAEDDYVYRSPFENVVKVFRDHPEVDFATPYYHPDYDNIPLHRHSEESFQSGSYQWKTVKATTGTFATRREIFRAAYPVFQTMLQKQFMYETTDLGVWLSLTKHNVFNPWSLASWPIRNKFFAWSLFSAWWSNWRHILFGSRYRLWAISPSLCTHLVEGLLAPGWDWHKEFETRMAKVKGEPRTH